MNLLLSNADGFIDKEECESSISPDQSGVYLLFEEGETVYCGQTFCLRQRMKAHYYAKEHSSSDGKHPFSTAYWWLVDEVDLDKAEQFLLTKYNPSENKWGNNKGINCKIDDCDKEAKVKGKCNDHYLGIHGEGRTNFAPDICNADECERDHEAGGFCSLHYDRVRKGIKPGTEKFLEPPKKGYTPKSTMMDQVWG